MANTTAQMANPAFQAVYSEFTTNPCAPTPSAAFAFHTANIKRDISTDSFANPPEFY